jgi:RHS repeat-associated protein
MLGQARQSPICNYDVSLGDMMRSNSCSSAQSPAFCRDFTGKERDNETGLDFFLARYYSAAQGRFLSPDEFKGGPVDLFGLNPTDAGPLPYADIRKPQSLNKYSYAYNNPLRFIDPTGHYGEDVHYGLTEALAEAVGYSQKDAAIIARADQWVDNNPATDPMKNGSQVRAAWHFASSQRDSEVWNSAMKTGSLTDLGAALHVHQDTYSHSDAISKGRTYHLTTAPDKTANDVGKANAMAKSTFDKLVSALGPGASKADWKKIEKAVNSFNSATSAKDKDAALKEIKKREMGMK